MKTKLIGYWVATVIIASAALFGGVGDLLRLDPMVETMVRLGYPLYVLTILGFCKVLGALVLLAPGLPRLKEWAYAGTFFDMAGAVASHVASGDGVAQLAWPALLAVVTIVSWALRPPGRTLGVLVTQRA
jgi:hypothetical protein